VEDEPRQQKVKADFFFFFFFVFRFCFRWLRSYRYSAGAVRQGFSPVLRAGAISVGVWCLSEDDQVV
jgi:hypothetical protein